MTSLDDFGPKPVAALLDALADALGWPRSRPARMLVGSRASVASSVAICTTEDAIDSLEEPAALVALASPPSATFAKTGRRAYDVFLGDSPVESWVRTERVIVDASEMLAGGKGGIDAVLCETIGLVDAGPIAAVDRDELKFIGFIPVEALAEVRSAVWAAGAGTIGAYDQCSFSTPGTGTFRAGADANPTVGAIGDLTEVAEVRFETVMPMHVREAVVRAFVEAHPYEEPAYDVVALRTPSRVGVGRRGAGAVTAAELVARLESAGIASTCSEAAGSGRAGTGLVAVTAQRAAGVFAALLSDTTFDALVCSAATDAERTLLNERGIDVITIDRAAALRVAGAAVGARLSRELKLGVSLVDALAFPAEDATVTTPAAATAAAEPATTPAPSNGAPASGRWQLNFDGGSRGNPGPAAYGFVILDPSGVEVVRVGETLGRTTNNVAEYTGLVRGLERALEVGADELAIRGDSELIVKQIRGEYRVKNEQLKPLYAEAVSLMGKFRRTDIAHVYRSDNSVADSLVNEALDAAR